MANRLPPGEPDPHGASGVPEGTLRALLATTEEIPAAIRNADVIFGMDVRDPESKHLFFGKATLERIVKTGNTELAMVVTVPVDFETDDVEYLVNACLEAKRSCCYSYGDDEERIDPTIN